MVIAVVGGLYMAWNIGANDVANAFGASVGSRALTIKRAVLLAAICEFAGAFFVGAPVSQTISGEIIKTQVFSGSAQGLQTFGLGMVAALLGASIWLNVATYYSQPVSTTHAIIGAVVGFAVVASGPASVQWWKMSTIAASWVVSPLCGATMAYLLYRFVIRRHVLESRHPVFMAMGTMPVAFGALAAIITFSVTYRGLPGLKLDWPLQWAIPTALGAGLSVGTVLRLALHKRMWRHHVRRAERFQRVEKWFGYMQVATACYMSFAHGANDVANAIGPMAAVIQVLWKGQITDKVPIPWWLLAVGGAGIVVGLATYGYKVIEAIGRKITEITPTRGFSSDFSTATTVLVFSKLGMPISTTFVIVGAVMGVGLARGFAAIDLQVVRRIFASWIITIPASAILTAIIYAVLTALRA